MLGNPVWLPPNTNTGTLHADLRAFYCFLRHKFAIKGLLRDTQYFLHCWQWYVTRQYTQKPLLCIYCYNDYVKAPQCYVIRTLPVLLLHYDFKPSFSLQYSLRRSVWTCIGRRRLVNSELVLTIRLAEKIKKDGHYSIM